MPIDALIVGLGNPGKEYERTRHNIGFMAVSAFARRYDMHFSGKRMQAEIASGHAEGLSLVVARPQTFMNASGTSVGQLVHWYKVPTRRVLIVYDEVDLPFGMLRLRPSGSAAGHKGIGSIILALGTQEVPRLRLGIGRPPGGGKAMGHVLKLFAPSERTALEKEILPAAVEAIRLWLTEEMDEVMRVVNAPREPSTTEQQPAARSRQE
ncbi:MAG TPA: aminoacyl-tRNA hydrolase, partial [Thermomicrobiales bacterium]